LEVDHGLQNGVSPKRLLNNLRLKYKPSKMAHGKEANAAAVAK
jgi:hypothetical protein